MNELKILLRLQWRLTIGSLKYGKRKKTRISGIGSLVLIAVIFGGSMSMNAISALDSYRELGIPSMMLFSGMAFMLMLEVMMAILRGASAVGSGDADVLLPLPLSRTKILISKSIGRYLFELLLAACLFLPYLVVYVALADHSLGVALCGLLTLLIAPLLTVGISYIFSYLFHKLGDKMPNPQTITSVLSLALVLAFVWFNMNVANSYPATVAEAMAQRASFPPAAWGVDFISEGDIASLLYLLLITVLPFVLGVRLSAREYGSKQRTYHSRKTTLDFCVRSPFRSLLHNESRRYFGSSIYLVNTIIGPVLMVGINVALIVLGTEQGALHELMIDPTFGPLLPWLCAGLYCLLAATVYTASCSISMEGRGFWIIRSLPLRLVDIFGAKICFNLLIGGVPAFVCSLASCLLLGYRGMQAVCIVILPLLTLTLIAVGGLYINLLFPKLDWDNEAAVVKQSMSAMLTFFVGGLLTVLPLIATLIWLRDSNAATVLAVWGGFYLVIIIVVTLLLKRNGAKRFYELE